MRFRRQDGRPSSLFFGATGWLFADLLLALTILFLVANTFGQRPPPPPVCKTPPAQPTTACVTPTPTATLTPTPTPQPPPLNLQYHPVTLTDVDYVRLQNGDQGEISHLEDEVRQYPGLAGRQAGLVITFGGSSGTGNQDFGTGVAEAFDHDVLKALGMQGFVFLNTVYREFHDLNAPPSTIEADVYLFNQ